MSTALLDLDLSSPCEPSIATEGASHLFVVAWRDGCPVASARVPTENGGVSRERLLAALSLELTDIGAESRSEVEAPAAAIPSAPHEARHATVVVCTRERPDRLRILLDDLRHQSAHGFELVVVDNMPRDTRARELLLEVWPTATYVAEPVPGVPHARNAGARAASGRIVAYTDDDCRPGPRWLESILRAFDNHPNLGCVTGPILPLELETPAQEAMEARGGFNRGFRRAIYTLEHEDGPVYPVQAWRFGAGASMAFTRECLRQVGGFDAALWRSEDIDIFYRVLRRGHALGFEPGAAVRHRHLPRWDQLRQRLFHWGWGYATYLDKIIRTDTRQYVERARRERRNWMIYQARHRLGPGLVGRADVPLPLVLREFGGAIAGVFCYPLGFVAASR